MRQYDYIFSFFLKTPRQRKTQMLFNKTSFLWHTALLMQVHSEVIAFYYVRPADVFDTVTIAPHIAVYSFDDFHYSSKPRLSRPPTVPQHSNQIWETPHVPSHQQQISLSFERLPRHSEVLAGQKQPWDWIGVITTLLHSCSGNKNDPFVNIHINCVEPWTMFY